MPIPSCKNPLWHNFYIAPPLPLFHRTLDDVIELVRMDLRIVQRGHTRAGRHRGKPPLGSQAQAKLAARLPAARPPAAANHAGCIQSAFAVSERAFL